MEVGVPAIWLPAIRSPDVGILLLRVLLTPCLIGSASLAGRRWGPLVSGWLVGLPFTSGPIALVLTLSHGASFAATAALGTLAGALSQTGFCLAYAWLAPHTHWLISLCGGCVAFAGATLVLQQVSLPVFAIFLLTCGVLCLALLLLPRPRTRSTEQAPVRREQVLQTRHRRDRPEGPAGEEPANGREAQTTQTWPWWDLPLRMALATAAVLVLTSFATALGARLTGLLAPFPLYAAVLAVFAHRAQGASGGIAVLRGLVLGLFAFASFFLVLTVLLSIADPATAFVSASAAALLVQGIALWATVLWPRAHKSSRQLGASEG